LSRRLKIDFVTKIRKVGSEKIIFFVEPLLFTGKNKIIGIEKREAMYAEAFEIYE